MFVRRRRVRSDEKSSGSVSPTAFIPLFTSCFNSLARSFTCSSKPAMVPPAHRKGEWMDQFSPFHYFNRGPSSIQWWVRAMMYRCDDHDSHDSWTSKKTAAIALDIRREQGVKPRSLQFKNPRESGRERERALVRAWNLRVLRH
ncbi:hypothetical protein GW17_00010540 [Ensete ventricosum]|nr:hypothetical protein GW17_00010540 [Ensete ventricosum]